MSIITSPEMFINMKRIPDKSSREYKPFFREEMRKIQEGVTINGVHIPSWTYWHINHWMIHIDGELNAVTHQSRRILHTPLLWDNTWIIGEGLEEAEINRKGILLVGTRQMSKSETCASYVGRKSIAYENTQNVIASLAEADLKGLTGKIEKGFNHITEYFRPKTIVKDWDKFVQLGYKDKEGTNIIWSEILIRNLDKGKNTEALAGPTTSSLLLEEVGKGEWLDAFTASIPSLETPDGWRCSPLAVGTSGNFEKSNDLKRFREHLAFNNFIQIEIKEKTGKSYSFFPGYLSNESRRVPIPLSDYLGKPHGSELDKIPIYIVQDIEIEKEKIKQKIEDKKKAKDPKGAKKIQMYRPLEESDLFLTDDDKSIFDPIKEYAREQLAYLEGIDQYEEYGWMSRDNETGKVKFTRAKPNQVPIVEFPFEEHEELDAPIIIWDHPLEGQQFGVLHVAGADPYNQDKSFWSDSLGSFYIYRRMYDALKGRHQNMFVASYTARPDNIQKWREQGRLLLEYYGATCLPENEEPGFIRWYDERNIGYYLEDGIDLAKQININTKTERKKGLSASIANINYGNELLLQYCNEDIIVGQNPQGENVIKKGIIRIQSKRLLKQIIAHKAGANVDEIVAARHALILAHSKDKYFPIAKAGKPVKTDERKKKPVHYSPFSRIKHQPFRGIKNPFGR